MTDILDQVQEILEATDFDAPIAYEMREMQADINSIQHRITWHWKARMKALHWYRWQAADWSLIGAGGDRYPVTYEEKRHLYSIWL